MKEKIFFTCGNCGHQETKWLGRCPECGIWNTFTKSVPRKGTGRSGFTGTAGEAAISVPLSSVPTTETGRLDTGNREINRVLGGGFMKGSTVLVGGEPGIGKSTLMIQLAGTVRTEGCVLYISGEESAAQLKMRADRLAISRDSIEVFCGTELGTILNLIDELKPVFVIVDSIQTIYSRECGSVPGTVSQIKYCCHEIIDWIKRNDSCLFLIGHVTKEGVIAGPKVIEHLVDTVFYFDQSNTDIRLLRPLKNRFGSTEEIGIFRMTAGGLEAVSDPALLFMEHREGELPSGISIAPVYEGSRILPVEIQSLVVPAKGGLSRVFSDRIDSRRVSRIAAVLEKHLKLPFSDLDIYVNVAGGIRIDEVAVDLALATSLYSAKTSLMLGALSVVFGEVSLAGEIRRVPHAERRTKACLEMGFNLIIGPVSRGIESQHYRQVADLKQAMRTVFGG